MLAPCTNCRRPNRGEAECPFCHAATTPNRDANAALALGAALLVACTQNGIGAVPSATANLVPSGALSAREYRGEVYGAPPPHPLAPAKTSTVQADPTAPPTLSAAPVASVQPNASVRVRVVQPAPIIERRPQPMYGAPDLGD